VICREVEQIADDLESDLNRVLRVVLHYGKSLVLNCLEGKSKSDYPISLNAPLDRESV
jgi:hypothetical protein